MWPRFIAQVALVCCLTCGGHAQLPAADLFSELFQAGLSVDQQARFPLPQPTVSPAQSPAEQQAAARALAGPLGWQRFSRKSVFAPVMIDLEYLRDRSDARWGHSIHTAFVAYAPWSELHDSDLLQQIFGMQAETPSADAQASSDPAPSAQEPQPRSVAQQIPAEELAKLGIEVADPAAERYSYVTLPLLNEVTVRGTLHVVQREGPGWIQIAWMMDPRFSKSQEFASSWTKVERDELGQKYETEPQPYSGCGGFLGITQLDAQQDQLLLESRMIMHEPTAWFSGSNYLRSKLPTALQENARKFRRGFSEQE